MQCVFHFSRNSRSQFPGSQPSDSVQEVLNGFLVCAQGRDYVGFKLERRTVLNITFHLNYLNYPPFYSLIVDKSEIQILSLISKIFFRDYLVKNLKMKYTLKVTTKCQSDVLMDYKSTQ